MQHHPGCHHLSQVTYNYYRNIQTVWFPSLEMIIILLLFVYCVSPFSFRLVVVVDIFIENSPKSCETFYAKGRGEKETARTGHLII